MKFVYTVTSSFLLSTAMANMATLNHMYETLIGIRNNGSDAERPALGKGPTGRFVPGVRFAFSMIQDYGCWCYLGDHHGLGKGQPQDEFDNICQKLHHAHTCADLMPGCEPDGKFYQVLATSEPNGDFVVDCETLNTGDECAEAVCYMEAKFTEAFITLGIEGVTPDLLEYKVDAGFDTKRCFTQVPAANPVEYTEICCGEYKHNTRKPIKVFEGEQRECCDAGFKGRFTVFNPTVNECCDGNVESLGSC